MASVAQRRVFPSVSSSLAEARDFVRQFARGLGLSEPGVSDVVAAVGEACANAILYGSPNKGFWVDSDHEPRFLTIRVHSFGSRPSVGNVQTLEPHWPRRSGLGIYLMRTFMDQVAFHMSDGGATVTLVKRVPEPARTLNNIFPLDEARNKYRGYKRG